MSINFIQSSPPVEPPTNSVQPDPTTISVLNVVPPTYVRLSAKFDVMVQEAPTLSKKQEMLLQTESYHLLRSRGLHGGFMYYIIRKYIFNGPLNRMFEVSKIYKIVWFWDVCEWVLPRIHLLKQVLLKGKRVLILVSRNGPWAFIRKGALNRTNNPVIFCMCKF